MTENGLVVGHVEFGALRFGLGIELDPVVGALDKDAKVRLQGVLGPVVDEGQGAQQQGHVLDILVEGCQDLDRFAEAHVVALEATKDLALAHLSVELGVFRALFLEL